MHYVQAKKPFTYPREFLHQPAQMAFACIFSIPVVPGTHFIQIQAFKIIHKDRFQFIPGITA